MVNDILIVNTIPCERACPPFPRMRVFHRDFPELWIEEATLAEGVERLAREIKRALDSAGDDRRREPLESALADVRSYADLLPFERTPNILPRVTFFGAPR